MSGSARNPPDLATLEAIAEMALQWATAREEAVATFGRGGADRHQLEAAWARLGRAETALLVAVQPLRDEEKAADEPFDPKAHPLVGKRFRLKYDRGMGRKGLRDCWETRTAIAGAIGTVVGVWADCVRMEMFEPHLMPPFTTEWVTAAAPYRMHEIVARFLEDVTPVEEFPA